MTAKTKTFAIAYWVVAAFVLSASIVAAQTYYESRQKCGVPTVVSTQGVRPNVLIVMDYSGSMQEPAYVPSSSSWGYYYTSHVMHLDNTVDGAYDPGRSYYGIFDSDTYYTYTTVSPGTQGYFSPAASQPTETALQTIVSSADGTTGPHRTRFTTSDTHGFAVDDWVVLSGLNNNKTLNGQGFQVKAANSTEKWFEIQNDFSDVPDTMGSVRKRIFGTWGIGVSGNFLNWATTSRIDAALKALTGGRKPASPSPAPPTGTIYLDSQGAERTFRESTNANAHFYVRPGRSGDPDDSSGGTYLSKTTYMDITARSRGTVNASDPANVRMCTGWWRGNCTGWALRRTDWWTFTLTAATTVTITSENNNSNAFLGISKASAGVPPTPGSYWTYNDDTKWAGTDSGRNPSVSVPLAAGTYYVAVTRNADFTSFDYALNHSIPLTAWSPSSTTYPTTDHHPCAVPVGNNIMVRLRIPEDQRGGVIKESFDNTRIGFMYFNSNSGNSGKMSKGCGWTGGFDAKGNPLYELEELRRAFEEVEPYNGTPTGEAMWEAYDYFKQANSHSYVSNSSFISRTTLGVDPYYERDLFDQNKFMPCRDSYVILVSDGEWNGDVDPIRPAREMHRTDLRTQETGDTAKQAANVFTFYAFSDSNAGKNAMKATAMYGSYTNDCDAPDDWPFPYDNYMNNSLNQNWPLQLCSKNPNSEYKPCCKEWNKQFDRDHDGVEDSKGVPDNYYEASDGAVLEAGLRSVFQSLIAKTGAAGSVATVAQKVSEHDVVVRAMFRAGDPIIRDRYIWRGHLESYYPYTVDGWVTGTYDFEERDEICKDIAVGERHCWDAGEMIAGEGESARTIYYGKYDPTAPPPSDSPDKRPPWILPAFSTGNWADLRPMLNILEAEKCVTTDTDEEAAKKLIRWIRGEDPSMGNEMECYRTRTDSLVWLPPTQTRAWPLGDLIYSTPLIVGIPDYAAVSSNDPDVDAYHAFSNAELARAKEPPQEGSDGIDEVYKKMVYVGGNDGMLHAVVLAVANGHDDTPEEKVEWIDSRTDLPECYNTDGSWRSSPESQACRLRGYVGKELWAYMPSNVLSSLKTLAAQSYGTQGASTIAHRFVIDLSPQVYQVYRTDTNPDTGAEYGWRQVIVGGQRGGGDVYFAIDVTDPSHPDLMWEYSVLKDFKDWNGAAIAAYPDYTTYYEQLKALPTTWSVPYIGRIRIPNGITFGGTPCTEASGCKKHLMFAGGGHRVFDQTVTVGEHAIDLRPLTNPRIIGIDLNTGQNLLGDLWPTLRRDYEDYPSRFPELYRVYDRTNEKEYRVPYALGDPLVLDEVTSAGIGNDGFVDRVYVGDVSGYLYGYKFNFDRPDTPKGVLIDVWSTRSISGCVRDAYRWNRQPITTRPQASNDPVRAEYLRLIVAAGKYDDAPGGDDDKVDAARASLYNLLDEKIPVDGDVTSGVQVGGGTGYKARLRFRCGHHSAAYSGFRDCYTRTLTECTLDCQACTESNLPTCCTPAPDPDTPPDCSACADAATSQCQPPLKDPDHPENGRAKCCYYKCNNAATQCSECATWVNENDKTADCGEATCCDKRDSTCSNPPCWACIYDLVLPFDSTVGDKANYPGERFVSKPLIGFGTVFITSYVPAYDPCTAMGTGYLYIFDYACAAFPAGWTPLTDAGFTPDEMRTNDNSLYGLRLTLGAGPPSDPVLDSSGNFVYVQMGTAEIIRIGVNLNRGGHDGGSEDGGGGGGGGEPVGGEPTGGGGTPSTPLPDWFRIRGWKESQ